MKPIPGASKIVPALARFFEGREEVLLAYLFGSAARGRKRPGDIDVATLVERGVLEALDHQHPWGYQAHLTTEIGRALGTCAVDAVILNRATPLLGMTVAREGILVFEAQGGIAETFAVEAFRRYIDTKPLRDLQRRCLDQRIESGRFAPTRTEGHWWA